MAVTVNQNTVLQDLSYLLGETTIPSSVADRETFIQRALERVYRIYEFPYNRTTATVQAVAGVATLPTDLRQDGVLDIREVLSGPYNDRIYQQVAYRDFDSYGEGAYRYYLSGHEDTYVANITETSTSPILTVYYEMETPTINASIATPFPSSMVLALGALIYYRESEDPYADTTPYEINFQKELNEIISQYNRNRPQPRGRTVQELAGTYTGDTDTTGVVGANTGNN